MDRDSTEEVKLRVEISFKLRKGVYFVVVLTITKNDYIQIKSNQNTTF